MSDYKAGQVLEATEGFVCEINGERYIVNAGMTRIDASHELAAHYPQHFRPVEEGLSYQVEAATANPGETRDRQRPATPSPEHSAPAPITTKAKPSETKTSGKETS